MIKQKKNSRKHTEERRAKLVVRQFRTYWLLSVSSSGIWARLPASGSANEFVSVGGESGSSEQQNEGRLLVSEMASGLQQQEAELCRPRLFCSLPAKSPISREECWNSASFPSNSRRSVLFWWTHFGRASTHPAPCRSTLSRHWLLLTGFFFLAKRRVWTSQGWSEELISLTGCHESRTKQVLGYESSGAALRCLVAGLFFKDHFQI